MALRRGSRLLTQFIAFSVSAKRATAYGSSAEDAHLVAQDACSGAQLVLATLVRRWFGVGSGPRFGGFGLRCGVLGGGSRGGGSQVGPEEFGGGGFAGFYGLGLAAEDDGMH